MKVYILLSVLALALADRECGENQHYNECGTMCPVTCENYHDPPLFCIKMCNPGCHCDEGYVKTDDGRCVQPEECPNRADSDVCSLPSKVGTCRGYFPRYYHNKNTGKCEKFIYGGCGGNENNFPTFEECQQACGVQASTDTCSLPSEVGICRGYFPRYYHNKNTGKCEKFIYGGCGGNENNFATLKECQEACGVQASTDTCSLPAVTGVCDAYFPRFYFNKNTGACEKFVYGGCGGNENNFETLEECQLTCASSAPSACLEDKVTGPCKARFMRHYFNRETGQCEEFTYGGCSGNSNNFLSKEDCEAVCLA